MTSLYLIPTPIGNLEDITLRSLRLLKEVDMILAEDTRTSGKLLKHYGIETPRQSYHIFNEHKAISPLIQRMKNGEIMALITDAGTPGISDPGFLLVRECIAEDLVVECLPGPTAFVPALVKSGLPSDKFVFEGFLPHKKGRATRINELKTESRTIVFYESPHRLIKTLHQLHEAFGDRMASVSRELTKIHEETRNDTLANLHLHYEKHPPKGEIVLIVEGTR
ncbi:16S rRNA (cytidine(1402)-2'-O)-methyltransferase [Fulvivirga sedimenti]|jgi:16S rRNA (cytidine1402-2'-O)-methyltransferase|uniref:Ribosomal RNA small subunit methyltransferase I n=1 Tax=Fulvivirga sedimenti TaxID=2879465 RepID=A0A9X1HTU9_9BACT|nr:16S rRNA (cytidine(1402)-2'-O)-methyltransferase [Fulvivirga sedimenti]MCA6078189.1 16S rRNA (cytidine(1402)-2'-O)-methyltransferase [Fulvivirga sedimenti]